MHVQHAHAHTQHKRTSLEAPPWAVEKLTATAAAVAASPRSRAVEPQPSVAKEAMSERPVRVRVGSAHCSHWCACSISSVRRPSEAVLRVGGRKLEPSVSPGDSKACAGERAQRTLSCWATWKSDLARAAISIITCTQGHRIGRILVNTRA